MKHITFILFFLLVSCSVFQNKPEHTFLYQFENIEEVSSIEISETVEVLKDRLTNFGIKRPIVGLNNEKQIEIIFKAVLDENRFDRLITNQGKLEFWDVYKGEDFYYFLEDANDEIKKNIETDSLDNNPLLDLLKAGGYPGGPILAVLDNKDQKTVMSYLNRPEIRGLLPLGKRHTKFLFGRPDGNDISLYAVKSNAENKPPLTGSNLTYAAQNYDAIGNPAIAIEMNEEASLKWEEMTERAFRQRSQIAIVLNDMVYSAPGVSNGAIKGGKSQISGNFTIEEAKDLVIILSSSTRIPKLKQINYSKQIK